jgi:hypothetical protein
MATLIKNEYLTVTWNQPHQLIVLDWTPKTYHMNDDEFKQNMNQISHFVQQYQIKHFLANTVAFDYVITPDVQDWVASVFNLKLMQAGLQKMAVVMPLDYFTQTSVQQTLKEMEKQNQGRAFESLYFGDLQLAHNWLLESIYQGIS